MANEVEKEAKFVVSDENAFQQIKALIPEIVIVLRYKILNMATAWITDIYFDTKNNKLRRAGITYRLRNKDGELLATFKQSPRRRGPIVEREEVEAKVTDLGRFYNGSLDIEPVRRITGLVGDEGLLEALVMKNKRTSVVLAKLSTRLEICLDEVIYKKQMVQAKEFLLEIELLKGRNVDIQKIADYFRKKYQLIPAPEPKYERGLRLTGYEGFQ